MDTGTIAWRGGRLSRRDALKLGLAGLLAGGRWPGARAAETSTAGGEFTFIVVNDTHYAAPECAVWLRGLVQQMRRHPATAFCLHLGDVTDLGQREHLEAARTAFAEFPRPVYVVPGNHDYVGMDDRAPFDAVFPGRLNYAFAHGGWQFIGLDSTEGQRWQNTRIQPATLAWLDRQLPQLDRRQPTAVFTHFPLGHAAPMQPLNADAVLERLLDFNLRAAFCGHHHGSTENFHRNARVVTNRCCARIRDNHDGSKAKGYWLCTARGGDLTWEFVEYPGPGGA
jgi:hypothetical protein